MTQHQFKSIKDKGGLKVHLNDPKQKEKHRGLGYAMWRTARKAQLNTTALAKLFNVTFDTAKDWKKIDDDEQVIKRTEDDKALDEISKF